MKVLLLIGLTLCAVASHGQIVPGSSGHGAPGFSCAANDTYKDVDNGLVWLCGPGNNNWQPTPQYVPWVSPAVGNCPIGNGTTFVSSPCGGSGGIQQITSTASTLTLGGDISNTTIDINLSHANTWVPLQSFTGGVKVGTGANAYIQQAPGGGIFQITNNANTIGIGIIPVGTTLGYSINGVSPTFSSAYFNMIIGSGSPIATGGNKIDTNPANFLSSDNAAEYQALTQIGSASIVSEIAQGNVTTVIKNTNIKMQGITTLAADPTVALGAATKQYVDGRFVIISNSADVAVAGFTTETVLCALKIPANTMSGTIDTQLSRFDGMAAVTTAGTSATDNIKVSLSTSATVVGTAIVSLSGGANRTTALFFHCSNRTSSSQICFGGVTSPTNASSALAATATLSVASDMYIVISSTQTVSTDTQTCRTIEVEVH